MEFLVHMTIEVPAGVDTQKLGILKRQEASRAAQLAAAGTLLRLWRDNAPGWTNWGLWSAPDEARLNDAISTLPLHPYMNIEVHALSLHPNDPADHDTPGGHA